MALETVDAQLDDVGETARVRGVGAKLDVRERNRDAGQGTELQLAETDHRYAPESRTNGLANTRADEV